MAEGTWVDMYLWMHGNIEYIPNVRYFGGIKVFCPDIDLDKFYLGTLIELYEKAGGKGLNLEFSYCIPDESMRSGLRFIRSDSDIREFVVLHRNEYVINIYVEEQYGPIRCVDKHGNDIGSSGLKPLISYHDNEDLLLDLFNESLGNFDVGVEKVDADNGAVDVDRGIGEGLGGFDEGDEDGDVEGGGEEGLEDFNGGVGAGDVEGGDDECLGDGDDDDDDDDDDDAEGGRDEILGDFEVGVEKVDAVNGAGDVNPF